jgi:cytosine/adenosine deaminase-related metal-dependent hydrolase
VTELLLAGAHLIVLDPDTLHWNADLFIEDNRVRWVEPHTSAQREQIVRRDTCEVIDASGWVVLPGLVNTHLHSHQFPLRSIEPLQHRPLPAWLSYMAHLTSKLSIEDCAAGVRAALLELALSGCTATVDMPWLVKERDRELLTASVAAAQEVGLRYVLVRSGITSNTTDGEIDTVALENSRDFIAGCEWAARHIPTLGTNGRTGVAIGPSNLFTSTFGEFQDCVAIAAETGAGFHTHFLESQFEEEALWKRDGLSPHGFLAVIGISRVKPRWIAHAVYANQRVIAGLADLQVAVASCPTSNARGEGIAPVRHMVQQGLTVGVGVDGPAGNDACNLLSELKMVRTLQGALPHQSYLTWQETLRIGTQGGAQTIGLPQGCGTLHPGAPADLAAFNLHGNIALAGVHHPVIGLLSCTPPRPELVMVDGEVIVRSGQHVRLDERDISAQIMSIVGRLRCTLPDIMHYPFSKFNSGSEQ